MLFSLVIFQLFFYDRSNPISVLLVYQPFLDNKGESIKEAYSRVLQEEGIPYTWQTRSKILKFSPSAILRNNPVMIFPDEIIQNVSEEFAMWVEEYITLGGNVLIVFDAGIHTKTGEFRETAVFSNLLGLNYITYHKYKKNAYQHGNIQFLSPEKASFFQIPPGLLCDDLIVSCNESGKQEYPVARVEVDKRRNFDTFAKTRYIDGTEAPNITLNNLGKGKAVFVNLPLGYLKAFKSDDLMLRSILTTFLFKIVKFPHMISNQFNIGGLVINWQLDKMQELNKTNFMLNNKLIQKGFKQSFHIAPDDLRQKTEGQIDSKSNVINKERRSIIKLTKYGKIGLLGNWDQKLNSDSLHSDQVSELDLAWIISRNSHTLSEIVGYDIKEFSTSKGYHNYSALTNILAKNGFSSYYCPCDPGSKPNHTFYDGNLVSNSIIAFPLMPIYKWTSIEELDRDKVDPQIYGEWLMNTLKFISESKTTAIINSQFSDFATYPQYIKPFRNFLDSARDYERKGLIQTNSMDYFAEYMNKFLKTKYNFEIIGDKFRIEVSNPYGLKGFGVAIPKKLCRRPAGYGLLLDSDKDYYYVIIHENLNQKIFVFPLR